MLASTPVVASWTGSHEVRDCGTSVNCTPSNGAPDWVTAAARMDSLEIGSTEANSQASEADPGSSVARWIRRSVAGPEARRVTASDGARAAEAEGSGTTRARKNESSRAEPARPKRAQPRRRPTITPATGPRSWRDELRRAGMGQSGARSQSGREPPLYSPTARRGVGAQLGFRLKFPLPRALTWGSPPIAAGLAQKSDSGPCTRATPPSPACPHDGREAARQRSTSN